MSRDGPLVKRVEFLGLPGDPLTNWRETEGTLSGPGAERPAEWHRQAAAGASNVLDSAWRRLCLALTRGRQQPCQPPAEPYGLSSIRSPWKIAFQNPGSDSTETALLAHPHPMELPFS